MINLVLKVQLLEKKCVKYSFFGILYTFLFKIFEVIPDVLYGIMIDTTINKNRSLLFKYGFSDHLRTIYILGAFIFIAWTGNIFFQYLSSLQWKHAARIIQYRLRMDLCLNLLNQEKNQRVGERETLHESQRSANEEIETVEYFIHITLYEVLKVLFSSLISGVLLFYISPRFLFYAIIPLLPTLFLSRFLQSKIPPHFHSIRNLTKQMFGVFEELVSNLTVIKDFGIEDRFYKRVQETASQLDQAYEKASKINAALVPANRIFIQFGVLVILVHGAVMVHQNQISFGAFAAAAFLSRKFLLPISFMGGVIDKFIKGANSAQVLLERFNNQKYCIKSYEGCDLEEKQLRSMSIRGLNFSYGQNVIADNLNLEFQSEKINVIKGRTGVGKTTLFRLLKRELEIDSGTVFYGSTDIKNYSYNAWRKKMAFVPQSPKLLNASILENVTLFDSDINHVSLKRALEISLTDQFVKNFPAGLNTVIGSNGISLSGGQIQSIAIARALYVESEILLLDEPTTGFDLERERLFLQELRRVLNGKMVIITSHRPQTIEAADSLFELHH